ncbi:5'-nucleotidase, lipoprotein e(P4) family [Fodinibius halophilus]|uniref:5'-nucleotidase, lipoprotein e(P4) family n=1 Tax=Fodinibius halophilus TaxID=1736908 RepID=A0A6M1SYU2_9BACT|nr:5'-nucleotidase, lipoprotein e(P4) family [Fodinibius halophilus]NGP89058.1 5'-nucleotidase, lipoprotein e(P4) family [Fodinibius halophilus]
MMIFSKSSFLPALFVAFISAVIAGCSSSATVLDHPATNSTLWMQNAAEYHALTTSVYKTAGANLALAVEDSYWSAYAGDKKDEYQSKPPAIILDVDETVLNNAPFQARMVKQNSDFNITDWNQWVMEAQATAIPGALTFTKRASQKGIAIYYLTNREAKVEEGTRKNLRKLGFPLSEDEDRILSKNERQNWTSAKTERRSYVAQKHRILMLFGDDLNDFISAKNISQQERTELVTKHLEKWGKKWFILPNPAYGSWESALYGFDNSLTPNQINKAKKEQLETKQK